MVAVPSCRPKVSSCAQSKERLITFFGSSSRCMAIMTCTYITLIGKPRTTTEVVKAVGKFGLSVMSVVDELMLTLVLETYIG